MHQVIIRKTTNEVLFNGEAATLSAAIQGVLDANPDSAFTRVDLRDRAVGAVSFKERGVTFVNADDASFSGTVFEKIGTIDNSFKNAFFHGCVFRNCYFHKDDFSGSTFNKCVFIDCVFDDVTLFDTTIKSCLLENVSFEGGTLKHIDASDTEFVRVSVSEETDEYLSNFPADLLDH
jgi:uncharacterized protein YjbI with pentapeptide repeats